MTISFPRLRLQLNAAPVEPPRRPRPKDRSVSRLLGLLPPVRTHRLKVLDESRRRLPLTDLDRHDLDIAADRAFAALAPGYPQDAAVTS